MAKNTKQRKLDNEVRKRKSNNIFMGTASEPAEQEASEQPEKKEAYLPNLGSLEEVSKTATKL